MGRAALIQTNMTGGELSPALALGRVDIAKYNNGAKRIENCALTVQGGAKRRPGTRFIATTKDQAKKSRLIEFVYNRGQAYVLEMGDGYMRFFKDRVQLIFSGSPYELVSPYTEAQLPAVNYVQKADTGFFVHESVFPYRLQRFSDLNWGMGVVPFITPAFEEQGTYPLADLTFVQPPGPVLPGIHTLDASVAAFYPSDVGRIISYNGGSAQITTFTSSTQVVVNVLSTFKTINVASGQWNLGGSPQDDIAPSSAGKVGQSVSLSGNFTYYGANQAVTSMIAGPVSAYIVVGAAHGLAIGDTVHVAIGSFSGALVVVDIPNATDWQAFVSGLNGFAAVTGTQRKVSVGGASQIWRAEDVGKVVDINGGLVEITSVPSAEIANGKVLRNIASDVPAGPNAWTLNSIAWNTRQGYPRAVTINQQRLLYAGSPGYPQHVWASEIQGYLNFQFGIADDEAFRFELDGPRNSPIRHLAPTRQLLVLTEADEMSLKGGQEKPITATNIQKTDESTTGAGQVRPVKIGKEILFVQAARKKVSAIGYHYEIDGFESPDRTVFASHISGTGITYMAHQKEPDSTLYAVRDDGVLAVCAYDIGQEVTGWGRWITDGEFETVATVPTATGEDTYTVVKRTINGVTKRYVEVFDPDVFLDCAITGTSGGAGQAVWTGLSHLEGETVQAWADGAYMGEFVVAAGQITLPRNANSVQIGLGFTSLVEMLQPEVGGNGTTAQGSQVHVNEVIIRVLDTSSAVINGQEIDFRQFGSELLDLPPPAYTGDVRKTTLSDEIFRTSQIIEQRLPLPFHLLDVIRRVTINDGG